MNYLQNIANGGYIDKSLINPDRKTLIDYENKELQYNHNHADIISSLPIISFICMPHNEKIFVEKYTIYRWLEFNPTNPFTNEDLDVFQD